MVNRPSPDYRMSKIGDQPQGSGVDMLLPSHMEDVSGEADQSQFLGTKVITISQLECFTEFPLLMHRSRKAVL